MILSPGPIYLVLFSQQVRNGPAIPPEVLYPPLAVQRRERQHGRHSLPSKCIEIETNLISTSAGLRVNCFEAQQDAQHADEQTLSLLHPANTSALSINTFEESALANGNSGAPRRAYASPYPEVVSPSAQSMKSQELPDHYKMQNLSNQGSAIASSKDSAPRHRPASSTLRRYPTRRIRLIKGSVLSANYPVPSPICNAIQAEYRDAEGVLSEEFTQMRCKLATASTL